jgi:thioredoxin 1
MRWQASAIVLVALGSGLAASKLLLISGMTNVAIRYPVAALIGYGAFAVSAMLWITRIRPAPLEASREPREPSKSSWLDIFDLLDLDEYGVALLAIIGAWLVVRKMAAILAESESIRIALRRMRFPVAAILGMSVALGAGVHHRCPAAVKLSDLRSPSCIQRPRSSIISNGAQKKLLMASEHTLTFTDGAFEQEVLKSDVPVLVDFWAPWCGPCKAMGPTIDTLAGEYAGKIKIGKMNTDDNPSTPMRYQVRGIPTLLLFKNGKVVEQRVGSMPKPDVQKMLDPHVPVAKVVEATEAAPVKGVA